MERRGFLLAVITVSALGNNRQNVRRLHPKQRRVIEVVLAHLFPPQGELPSAQSTRLIAFVEQTLFHPSFDKDIRLFLQKGAQKLLERTKGKVITASHKQLEQMLRSYEKTAMGSGWLNRLMIVGLEGLLSDPIYGPNAHERAWKVLRTKGGYPRPKQRYLGK